MSDSNRDFVLAQGHIGKLYSNLQRSWDVRGRLLIALILFSAVLIGISTGALLEVDGVSAGGFDVSVSIRVLASLAMLGITILAQALVAVDLHSDRIRDEIIRLYHTLAYQDDGLMDSTRTPLEGPTVIHATFSSLASTAKRRGRLGLLADISGVLGAAIVILLLPIGSQLTGAFWLVAQFEGHWIAGAGSILCILGTALVTVSGLARAGAMAAGGAQGASSQ
jgi:hypothetical protein